MVLSDGHKLNLPHPAEQPLVRVPLVLAGVGLLFGRVVELENIVALILYEGEATIFDGTFITIQVVVLSLEHPVNFNHRDSSSFA